MLPKNTSLAQLKENKNKKGRRIEKFKTKKTIVTFRHLIH